METDPGLLDRFTQNASDAEGHLRKRRGERGLSDEAFIEWYNESFELAEAKETQIITWEVTMVHGWRRQRPPLNRKVVMRVSGADLQRETGVSDEALAYMRRLRAAVRARKMNFARCSRHESSNCQWCLKVLYDLIMEEQAPQRDYRFTPEGPVEPS